eukprot:COSAG05_NODE_840_length_7027_cov_416.630052_6_plen_163_part_00
MMVLARLLLVMLLSAAPSEAAAPATGAAVCAVSPSLGCFHEHSGKGFQGSCPKAGGPCGRCVPYFVGGQWNAHTSRQNCACLCHRQGFALAGVENGANCYCAMSASSYNGSATLPPLCSGPLRVVCAVKRRLLPRVNIFRVFFSTLLAGMAARCKTVVPVQI